jgi:Fe2+ or Zn2+ uptake regulation protein
VKHGSHHHFTHNKEKKKRQRQEQPTRQRKAMLSFIQKTENSKKGNDAYALEKDNNVSS